VVINQAEALEWIDQLRVTIPEEVKSARRVTNEAERLLEEAREEAEQILARAQEQATYLIEERELTRQADEIGQEIIRQAQAEATETRRGADDYAADVLANLETDVGRTLRTIRRGLELLAERQSVAATPGDGQGETDESDEPAEEQAIPG